MDMNGQAAIAVEMRTGVTGAGDSGQTGMRAQTGSSAQLARSEAEARMARGPETETLGRWATWDTRYGGEEQRARRKVSAASGSEMGRETRRAEARTAKGRRTGRRAAEAESLEGRLREAGGVETVVDESGEEKAESAVPDGGLSGAVAESEEGGVASGAGGENPALAENRKRAGGSAKGSSSGSGSGGEGARLSVISMRNGG